MTSTPHTGQTSTAVATHPLPANPWPALGALCLGFFMILVDTTIVTVATPALMRDLNADVTTVVWVTSAYLLAYAVPVLITGRLGDRFGPKRLYLLGLAGFTAASVWCGSVNTIEWLIIARIFQGLAASLMAPQTMAVITRIFAVEKRGQAMAMWGATAGVATLVGPIAGGVLVDHLGWEWIFFVNLPVGLIALVFAARVVPALPTHPHRFDWLGVALSGLGMFCLVFGLQEAQRFDWGQISGPITVWRLIILGVLVLGIFVWWQARNATEPLMPLGLFRDRNFAVANVAITTVGAGFTAMGFPMMIWAQTVRGYTPTQAGMLLIPMAVMSIVLAPLAGRLTDKVHPRWLATFGFVVFIGAMALASLALHQDQPLWKLLVALGLVGVGSSFLWGPMTTSANRNLPLRQAGAGSGVYNAIRMVGSVLGSAAIAVLMESRLSAAGLGGPPTMAEGAAMAMPPAVSTALSTSMAESLLLVPALALIGLVAVQFFERPKHFDAG